jgi:hypothetical protein
MKVGITALLAVASICVSSTAAFAADSVVAKLQTAVEGTKKPIAGAAVFVCEGDTCTAANATGETYSVSGCRQLARAVGQVASFSSGERKLDDAKLGKCNASAKK